MPDFGFEQFTGTLILIIVLFALLGAAAVFIKRRYKVVLPNQALIISGTQLGKKKTGAAPESASVSGSEVPVYTQRRILKVVQGGGVFVLPVIQKASSLNLEAMAISVDVQNIPTVQKVPISLDSTANVRIGNTAEEINMAAVRFLSWGRETVENNIREVLAGSIRAIIGQMTVEEIIENRDEFASKVQEIASKEMQPMGLVIDVMNIKEINDTQDYIRNLGVPQSEEVRKKAEQARADADLEITRKVQDAEREKALVTRDTQVRKSEYQAEQDSAQRTAEQAGPLAEAEAKKQVVKTETEVAELAAQKREMELISEKLKPAEAERDATIIRANAERQRLELEGQGNAAKLVAEGNATAEITKTQGLAEADAASAMAKAEGAKVREVKTAEAEGMKKEAEALNDLQEASLGLKQLEIMPQIAKELASQLAGIDGLVLAGEGGLKNFLALVPHYMEILSKIIHGPEGNGSVSRGKVDILANMGQEFGPEIPAVLDVKPVQPEKAAPDQNTVADVEVEDRRSTPEILTSLLREAEGSNLSSKLMILRSKGGRILEAFVDSDTLDQILSLAESSVTKEGAIEVQVNQLLDLINADPDLRKKAGQAISSAQKMPFAIPAPYGAILERLAVSFE